MNHRISRPGLLLSALLLSGLQAFGSIHSISNQSSVAITSAQHGCSTAAIGVRLLDASNNVVLNYTPSFSGLTLTLTFGSNFTGTAYLTCAVPTSQTSNPFTYNASSTQVTIGQGASPTAMQRIDATGKSYVTTNQVTYDRSTSAARTVYVFITSPGVLTFCESGSTPIGFMYSGADYVNVTGGCGAGFPGAGERQLYKFDVTSGSPYFINLTDYR